MKTRNALFTAMALGLALSAPMAFAQEASTDASQQANEAAQQANSAAQQATDAAQEANSAAQQATDASATAQQQAPAAEAPRQITWADLDTDKDGKLTKGEAAPVQALSSVFEEADSDKDGSLTPDEYKAYVAKNQGAAASNPEG